MYLYLLFDKAEALDAFKVFKNRGREEKKKQNGKVRYGWIILRKVHRKGASARNILIPSLIRCNCNSVMDFPISGR